MKKSLIVTLALVFVLGIAGTAFAAANPFVDVPAKHWAYDAVSKLAQAGVVDGYGDGTFRGDKTITRYEMAQIVAKAMARSDKQNAETKALVDKLAVEFSAELQNLGVRVAKLEANQPNLKFSGVADYRYTATDNNVGASAAAGQWRLRMDGTAKIDDQTALGLRFTSPEAKSADGVKYKYYTSTWKSFGANEGTSSTSDSNQFNFDRMFITRQLGEVKTTLGAQAFKIGTGMLMDNAANSFDGIAFAGKTGVVNWNAQWGRFAVTKDVSKIDVATLEANSTFGKLAYGLGYASMKDNQEKAFVANDARDLRKYTYVNAAYTFDNKVIFGGEYAKNSSSKNALVADTTKDNTAYNLYVQYGDQVLAKKGDNNVKVTYLNAGMNAVTKWSAFDMFAANADGDALNTIKNTKSWTVQYNYAFSKTLTGWGQYMKAIDKDNDGDAVLDMGKTWYRFGVTAKF